MHYYVIIIARIIIAWQTFKNHDTTKIVVTNNQFEDDTGPNDK